ncbi:CAZyme family GT71 [Penicillium macrosclerotiorum]|uniref:CAZyme family GT71 n=1 Tax=Penicillium macrosclerotiorum TaxID=303699 RepID=UPI0025469F10|nr:CAZyme family GT71 [Penicillium macrosclerotiorum]KAJ5669279.1 CAZyme family GT71 [Penicillium macrosclerotiorum]
MAFFPRSCLRARTLITALSLALLLTWTISQWHYTLPDSTALSPSSQEPPSSTPAPDLTEAHQDLWLEFHQSLEKHVPGIPPITDYPRAPTERFDANEPGPRPDYLDLAPDDVHTMQRAHTEFVASLTSSPPQLPYIPGTKGIVSTAGGAYLPVLVISLRMLRRTGSTLPMEVFLADETEYEAYICDVVLPSLGARCIVLSRILAVAPAHIAKYQFKPFAMLFSSFEELLFLDADAFPLTAPETLFRNEPFRATGLVTWPDFWASSTSPHYFTIAGVPAPAMGVRQSGESGELLLSKAVHAQTLLLATYYNYWGPTHYWALLSQGAAGEGDKETFVAAALALGAPFYQVSEAICALGHRKADGGFGGSAMAQFDPGQDWALVRQGKMRVRGDEAPAPDVFFVHANFPKFNPATVFDAHEVAPAFGEDGEYARAWTIPEDVVGRWHANGGDMEKAFWKEILWTACELEDKFVTWQGRSGICARVTEYWHSVFEWKPLPS